MSTHYEHAPATVVCPRDRSKLVSRTDILDLQMVSLRIVCSTLNASARTDGSFMLFDCPDGIQLLLPMILFVVPIDGNNTASTQTLPYDRYGYSGQFQIFEPADTRLLYVSALRSGSVT